MMVISFGLSVCFKVLSALLFGFIYSWDLGKQ